MQNINAIQATIVKQGVANLREFGYPDCDEVNIFTDRIYSAFFKSILEDNMGKGADAEINDLLSRMAVPDKGKN